MNLKALLLASAVMSLAGGCIAKDGPDNGAIDQAIPTSDQVQIKLPAANRVVGQLAQYYVVTHDATTAFNGGAAWVLVLIHSIVQLPVSSVSGNVYTWGPGSQPLDPANYRLDVTANTDGTFDYVLSGQNKSVTSAPWLAIVTGHADPGATEGTGNGTFTLNFDASAQVDPIDNASNKGQIAATYDLDAKTLGLHISTTDANNSPVVADYAYAQNPDDSGDMTFSADEDVGGGPALENLTVRSRWLATGAGRSDVRLEGGDLGATEAIASQCWNTNFLEVYYTDNVNFLPTDGDPTQCAYANVDLP
ncbi:MAG TPA: hypothetical protein VGG28_04835 [Kofleriaceae bacterium]|jgi:hypothetical protein